MEVAQIGGSIVYVEDATPRSCLTLRRRRPPDLKFGSRIGETRAFSLPRLSSHLDAVVCQYRCSGGVQLAAVIVIDYQLVPPDGEPYAIVNREALTTRTWWPLSGPLVAQAFASEPESTDFIEHGDAAAPGCTLVWCDGDRPISTQVSVRAWLESP